MIKKEKVKIIIQTQAWGPVVTGIIIEYEKEIDPSSISLLTFEVLANRIKESEGELAPRTIIRVYTNNKPEFNSDTVLGRYVIIELNSNDLNAKTIYPKETEKGIFNFDYDLEYIVIQKANIKTIDAEIIPTNVILGKDRLHLLVDNFKNYIYKNSEGKELPYSLFVPINYNPNKSYPLVVFLHGAGERGYNNQIHIKANEGAVVWASDLVQNSNPCFVLAPQCPQDSAWTDLWGARPFEPTVYLEMVHEIIMELVNKYNIDKKRIYLTGLSMGGFGTWALAMAHPDTFAGLVPICGGGDPSKAHLISHIPAWVFTAEDDPVVNVKFVRNIVKALQNLKAPIRYTEYEKGVVSPPLGLNAHWSWVPAYKNQRMIEWLFSQIKNS